MSEMKERSITVPVIDEKTHFIISYEDLTKEEWLNERGLVKIK